MKEACDIHSCIPLQIPPEILSVNLQRISLNINELTNFFIKSFKIQKFPYRASLWNSSMDENIQIIQKVLLQKLLEEISLESLRYSSRDLFTNCSVNSFRDFSKNSTRYSSSEILSAIHWWKPTEITTDIYKMIFCLQEFRCFRKKFFKDVVHGVLNKFLKSIMREFFWGIF